MKYIDTDKLVAEIERRIEEVNIQCQKSRRPQFSLYGKINGLEQALNLVRSLQQEQPEVDLEKDIQECWQNWLSPSNQNSVDGVFPKEEFAFYARHFYELGRNTRKEE